jgi:sigma-B regulation protein RsbU (phosphoserine phosphatase)
VAAVCSVSRQLLAFSRSGDFATLFIALLDPISNSLRFVNAGHNPPLVIKSGGEKEYLDASGIPLGAMAFDAWKENSIAIREGDVVFVFTDGIPEAVDSQDEQFGDDRLEKLAVVCAGKSPKEFTDAVMTAVSDFIGEFARSDDITMLILRRDR